MEGVVSRGQTAEEVQPCGADQRVELGDVVLGWDADPEGSFGALGVVASYEGVDSLAGGRSEAGGILIVGRVEHIEYVLGCRCGSGEDADGVEAVGVGYDAMPGEEAVGGFEAENAGI